MDEITLLTEYTTIKETLGHSPSWKEFQNHSKITLRQLQAVYGRNAFSKLVTAAGDAPNSFNVQAKTDTELLEIWGHWVRKLGYAPGIADWLHHQITPAIDSYRRRFGSVSNIVSFFRTQFAADNQWSDVRQILGPETTPSNQGVAHSPAKTEFPRSVHIPLLDLLVQFSTDDAKSLEFEKIVAQALQILGFAIKPLGQGTGRNPDGLGFNVKHHAGFFYDAKARREKYALGTDDRTFNEYISTHRKAFTDKGILEPFFLVVSSDFAKASSNTLEKVATPIYLLTATQLSMLVQSRIQHSAFFDPEDLLLFLKGCGRGIVEDQRLNVFLKTIAERYARELL